MQDGAGDEGAGHGEPDGADQVVDGAGAACRVAFGDGAQEGGLVGAQAVPGAGVDDAGGDGVDPDRGDLDREGLDEEGERAVGGRHHGAGGGRTPGGDAGEEGEGGAVGGVGGGLRGEVLGEQQRAVDLGGERPVDVGEFEFGERAVGGHGGGGDQVVEAAGGGREGGDGRLVGEVDGDAAGGAGQFAGRPLQLARVGPGEDEFGSGGGGGVGEGAAGAGAGADHDDAAGGEGESAVGHGTRLFRPGVMRPRLVFEEIHKLTA